MTDAYINVILGAVCIALALFGPWRRNSWWPASALFGAAAFNVALGLATLA